MNKEEFVACMYIHRKLKDTLKGSIFISINKNKIKVIIQHIKGGRYIYTKELNNLHEIMKNNKLNSYIDEIYESYHGFISDLYFKSFMFEKGE